MIKYKIKTNIHGRCDRECELNGEFICNLWMCDKEIDEKTKFDLFTTVHLIPGKECPLHKMSDSIGTYSINFRLEEGD